MQQYTEEAVTPGNDFKEDRWYKIEKLRDLQMQRFGRSESLSRYSRAFTTSLPMEKLKSTSMTEEEEAQI